MIPWRSFRGESGTADETRLVLDAANRLQIKEFDLFDLAHRWWFGRRAKPEALERVFVTYMFARVVPPWVRHFAREILRELARDCADLARFGLEAKPPELPPAAGRERLIMVATFAACTLLYVVLLGHYAVPDHGLGPPQGETAWSCAGSGPGLGFFESLAFAISGKDPPDC